MRTRSIIASGLTVLASAGLMALAPSAARATNPPPPSCEQEGSTGQRNIYYFGCEEFVAGSPYLTWSGAPIVRGQGTGELTGTCIGGSLPYYIKVSWTVSGVTYTAQTTLTCRGGGPV